MTILIKGLDSYKLASPDYSDQYECQKCDELFDDEDLHEMTYFDADGDKQTKHLCGGCIDRIHEGDV
jgi:hypothetical protein